MGTSRSIDEIQVYADTAHIDQSTADNQPLLPFRILPLHFDRVTTPSITSRPSFHTIEPMQLPLWEETVSEFTIPLDRKFSFDSISHSNTLEPNYSYQQNEIEKIAGDSDNNIVFLVPRSRHPILNRHFPSWVAKNRKLRELSFSLADHGILRLGEVVQMTKTDIISVAKVDFPNDAEKRAELLEHKLTTAELRLGMRAPGWSSPGGLLSPEW